VGKLQAESLVTTPEPIHRGKGLAKSNQKQERSLQHQKVETPKSPKESRPTTIEQQLSMSSTLDTIQGDRWGLQD
jgi:hypothetical protein